MKMYASPALESNVDVLFVFANVSLVYCTYCHVMFADDFLTLIYIYIHALHIYMLEYRRNLQSQFLFSRNHVPL